MESSDFDQARQMNLAAGECLKKGDFGGALENFSKALALLPEGEPEAKARLHSNMGYAQVSLQRFEDALSAFKNAAAIFARLGDHNGRGEQLGNIGSVYRDMEKWDLSLDSYFKALEAFQGAGNRGGVADQHSNIAYAYSRKGDLRQALHLFKKAKTLYDTLGEERKSRLCEQNLQALEAHVKEQDSLHERP